MKRFAYDKGGLVRLGVAGLLTGGLVWGASCSSAPTPFVVQGPGGSGSDAPTMTILEPTLNGTIGQGDRLLIRWTDSDRDTNAQISFYFVDTRTNARIALVQGIDENDSSGLDSVSIGTSAVPEGAYNLSGIIDDDENPAVEVYAMTTGTGSQRLVINVVPQGTQPPTRPPVVATTQPVYNLSVAEEDTLTVEVQPTLIEPADNTPAYDADSEVRLFILLDTDLDPNNDDPANPASNIILLQTTTVAAGNNGRQTFNYRVDLRTIPPRPNGEPYFVRATADDLRNPRVHSYASGKISVVELAAGLVDLYEIGRSKAGARWYGFNPGAQTGSSMAGVGDFDADGFDDFILVAQFGNPRNFGMVGEAYLVYGLDGIRFGGSIAVNTVAESVSGAIFEAPPIRLEPADVLIPTPTPAHSDGITSVSFIPDVTADGRPELLFGLAHVHGAFESMDFDPGDSDDAQADTEEVAVTVTQGRVGVTEGEGDEQVSPFYNGVEDVTISSATPGQTAGSSPELGWRNDPAANVTQWVLIKYKDVLSALPDADNLFLIDTSTVDAQLEFRIFDTGGSAAVHALFTDFDEQTTFNNFGGDGGPPIAGTDYLVEALGTIDSTTAETVNVDISNYVRLLIDGVLAADGDELRFIIVPAVADADEETRVRSSEFGTVTSRPTLRIDYQRFSSFGALGCYPDNLVNNLTTSEADDLYYYAGGMAVMVNSQNRDNRGVGGVNVNRMESTVVTLELAGQESGWALDREGLNRAAGTVTARVDNDLAEPRGNDTQEGGRIAGARFIAGHYDYIDHDFLRQGPREDLWGQTVSSIGDLNNDGLDEILISAPRNERYLQDLQDRFGIQGTQYQSTGFFGSIALIPGNNYNQTVWRDLGEEGRSVTTIPTLDQQRYPPFGNCSNPPESRDLVQFEIPVDSFDVFAESIDDHLGGAVSAGDFNQDGLDEILCGAPLNDRPGRDETGATYILYGRNILGDFNLKNADDQLDRPPMLRIRGVKPGDQVGWRQVAGLDVNGDRLDDIFMGAPRADFGGVTRASCGGDFNRDGIINADDFNFSSFQSCVDRFQREGQDLFSDDACKVFDYDNDDDIDDNGDRVTDNDRFVLDCLRDGRSNCCENQVDNGFVGIIFGGVFTDGDRDITQIATADLPGTVFFGSAAGHRAGLDVSSAGDFNQDGFGDILIVAPGEVRLDSAGRQRLGVVYLVFGGTHLTNSKWSLSLVGSPDLAGIVFVSPYVKGRPNEAAPSSVSLLGDINNDGFGDICIGNPKADFIDLSFPQGPDSPSGDAAVGRRRNAGDAYLIYGNNFGTNRGG